MDNEKNEIHAPDISGEKMKMPTNQVTTPVAKDSDKNALSGIIILILALLLVFILGGLYLWFSALMAEQQTNSTITAPEPVIERPTAEENNEPESTTAEAAIETGEAMSTSDEIFAIEADLEATDLKGIDAELAAIEAELEAAATTN